MPGGTWKSGRFENVCQRNTRRTGVSGRNYGYHWYLYQPHTVIAYSDGEVRQEFAILYLGQLASVDEKIVMDQESSDYKWVKLEHAVNMEMTEPQKQRIQDVIEYMETGKRALK